MISYLKSCEVADLQGYAFCIIGGGAAGISTAISLSRKGHQVLLVETGDWKEDQRLSDNYIGQVFGDHPATSEFRRQRFGGTTHLWGGRCVPMDPMDLVERDYVPNSGWPLDYGDLASYYPQAMDYCDAGAADFSIASLMATDQPMFEALTALSPSLVERIERYSLPTDFGAKYRQELSISQNVRVLLRARCVSLDVNANGNAVNSAELSDGVNTIKIVAKRFILAGGGIETTRLLLTTKENTPSWKRFDNSLGKYYACHFDLIFGDLAFGNQKPYFKFQKTKDNVYARRKLQFSKSFQEKNKLLNSTFRLHFPAYADASHGSGVLSTIYLAKSILASEYQSILNHGSNGYHNSSKFAHIKNVVTDIDSVFGFASDWLFKRKLAHRKLPYTLIPNRNGSYPLEFNSEQVPDASNRIELQDQFDRDGMRRVDIHWKLTDIDINSGIESFIQFQKLINSTNACHLDFDHEYLKERISSAPPVGGHHIGSTRMGLSSDSSVVDMNCMVHGVDNLFVASASTFPTNGHANPTLTLVALSIRLAAFLDKSPLN